ncbi:hypothetical protein DFH08DRAFT_814464 [Mycena albidolilacea]|uniref:Uncharacterized protein n=1 Tax=Mycena albidolilacea TaxID=1033008 RepID=A0AAD6ZPI4_9AGAR|nr:hypothetical protein DFH08DRAFT_814464 [Mycena albidolilacea]
MTSGTGPMSAAFSAALATTWRLPAVRASLQDLPPLYSTRWTGSPESPHSAAAFGPRLACCCAAQVANLRCCCHQRCTNPLIFGPGARQQHRSIFSHISPSPPSSILVLPFEMQTARGCADLVPPPSLGGGQTSQPPAARTAAREAARSLPDPHPAPMQRGSQNLATGDVHCHPRQRAHLRAKTQYTLLAQRQLNTSYHDEHTLKGDEMPQRRARCHVDCHESKVAYQNKMWSPPPTTTLVHSPNIDDSPHKVMALANAEKQPPKPRTERDQTSPTHIAKGAASPSPYNNTRAEPPSALSPTRPTRATTN